MSVPPTDGLVAVASPPERRRHLMVRLLHDPVAVAALVILALLAAASVLAPVLTSHDPIKSSLFDTLAPMGPDHPLGADGVGRDVWAQLLYGARTSLAAALVAVAVAFAVGIPAGLLGGPFGS